MQGRILKATGGFYYVLSDAVLYECRARGLFRKNGVSPLVGDWVEIEETGEEKGYVTRILDRKNSLIRPPLANLDQLFLVVSVADPQPNLLVLDKLIANGQVATQYVDLEGQPTMDQRYNPNGSLLAIEGITSPDGRVFGKMGHSERSGEYLYKNVTGDKYQPIFEGGVDYFKV